jgi:aldose 1-epimerase
MMEGSSMSQYSVQTLQKEGFSVIELRDTGSGSLAEIVPEIGNNLYRFESGGRQVLTPPASLISLKNDAFASYKYGVPILFPPNRVKNGNFMFKGRMYNLPLNEPDNHLHGELGSRAWEVIDLGVSEEQGAYVTSRFRFADHLEILRYFPHPLSFTVTCRLQDGRLHMDGVIINEGEDEEAPFAFGLHPYFSLPYESGEQMILTVPASGEWPVTNEAFVTGTPAVTQWSQNLNEGVNLTEFPPLHCTLVSLSEGDRICRIALKDSGYSVAYWFDEQFPFVVLFRPDWSSAFSLEPYTYVTDAFNLPYVPEITGAKGISPGEEIRFATSMWIEPVQQEGGIPIERA